MISEELTAMLRVRVSKSTKKWIEDECDRQNLSISEFVRACIETAPLYFEKSKQPREIAK